MAWGSTSYGNLGGKKKDKKGSTNRLDRLIPGQSDTSPSGGPRGPRPRDKFGVSGTGIGTNRNKGNERFGKTFTEEKAKGGVWHVYGKNDRVFVPGKTAKKGKPMRGRSEAVSMIVDAMRGGPIKGKGGLPKPGDKGRRTLPGSPIAPRQQIGTVNNPTEVAGSKPYARDRARALSRAQARKMRARDRDRQRVSKR